MKRTNNTLRFIILGIAGALLVFASCNRHLPQITDEQAADLAQSYFQEIYNMKIIFKSVKHEQVDQYQYLNLIIVSDGDAEYELILDENNIPLADNVSELRKVKSINVSSFNEKIEPLGLKLNDYYDLYVNFSYSNRQYIINFVVDAVDLPDISAKDGIYSLLGTMKNKGVDEFTIAIKLPDFLSSKEGLVYGTIQLDAEIFNTNMDVNNFDKKFDDFVNEVYWNRQKFEDRIFLIAQAGYENVYFIIQNYTANTIEIGLHCESDVKPSEEQIASLLEGLDNSYFRIRGRETKYTMQWIQLSQ